MTDPKIRVSADVSGINAELAKVEQQAKKINETLSSGEVGLDVKTAKNDLAALEKSAANLASHLANVAASGEAASGVDFNAVGSALENATKQAGLLEQVLDAVGQSTGLSASIKQSQTLVEHLRRAAKAQEALSKDGIKLSRQQAEEAKKQFDAWRKSGARGTSKIRDVEFDDWITGGWRNYSMDEKEARRHRTQVLRSVGVETPGGGSGDEDGRKARRGWDGFKDAVTSRGGRAGAIAGAAGGMASSMMQGGDGGMFSALGGGAGTLIGGAAGASFGGPAGALVGAAASQLLGGVGSTIDGAINRVIDQNSVITDLRHSLGATTTDFDMLRASVMYFTENLGITGQESAKLARAFSDASGKTLDALDVGRATGDAVGFARGYGMDPNAAVQFFGAMRHFGVTKDSDSDKRLALMVGEAVARNGMTPKMGEVMSALQNYVESQTRSSLTSANSEAYTSFMTSMTGLSLAGMKGDPATAMSAMGAADASLRRGGAFGEASKMFTLGVFQRMLPGFNALNLGFVQDQGAFGTVGRAFGENSPAMAMANAMGDKRAAERFRKWAAGQGSDQTILSLQMRGLEKYYGGSVEEMNGAIQNHLGVSAGQASALYNAFKNDKGLGGLQGRLKAAGVDVGGLDSKRIAALAQVDQMDGSGIRKEAKRLLDSKELSGDEEKKLNEALAAGRDEETKKLVLNLSALHDTTKDDGAKMREQQANMVRSLDKIANEMIPLVGYIKDAVLAMVQKIAPDSGIAEKVAAAEQRVAAAQADTSLKGDYERIKGMKPGAERTAEIDRYNYNLGLRQKGFPFAPMSPLPFLDKNGKPVALNGNFGSGGKARGPKWGAPLSPDEMKYLAETDRLIGAAPGTSAAQIQYESGLNPLAVSPAGAWGLAQLMPKTRRTLEGRMGRPIRSRMDQLQAHRMLMQENIEKFGNVGDALRAYNNGWKRSRWNNPETSSYASGVEETRKKYYADKIPIPRTSAEQSDGKVPAAHRDKTAMNDSHQLIEHRVTVLDSSGSPHYNSVTQTRVGHPVPAGMA